LAPGYGPERRVVLQDIQRGVVSVSQPHSDWMRAAVGASGARERLPAQVSGAALMRSKRQQRLLAFEASGVAQGD